MSKTSSVAETLQKAFQMHQAGQLDKAERLYNVVLKKNPNNVDALNLKGVITHTRGRYTYALTLFDRATAALPTFAEAHFNKANCLKALERNDEALAAYAKATSLKPSYAEARLNAGTLLHKIGRTDDAIATFRDMVHIAPDDPRSHYNLGVCLTEVLNDAQNEDYENIASEAEAALKQAIELSPNNADAHLAYANLFAKNGDHDRAIQFTKSAIKLKPNWPEAHSNLGEMLRKEHNYLEAIKVSRHAVALQPNNLILKYNLATALYDAKEQVEATRLFQEIIETDSTFERAYINLAIIYRDKNRKMDAIDLLEQALALNPSLHKAYANIGTIFSDSGWASAALMLYDKAISMMEVHDPSTLYYRGIVLLSLGRLTEGWPLNQYRYDLQSKTPNTQLVRRSSPPAYWNNEDLDGKNVVVWTEQGLGDEALYSSILPEVISRVAHCTIECSKRMAPVFMRSFPSATVIGYEASNFPVMPADGFDYQIPMASLGLHFRPDFSSFPRHEGYLKSDPDKVAKIRTRYESLANGRRIVGLSWRSKNELVGKDKSIALVDLANILQVPDIMFVNLQYGDCTEELANVSKQLGVEVVQDAAVDPLTDMDMFFAQVAAMDLVLSTSNTTVHVAGSQNIPVWVLLPHGKGLAWYWFLQRRDSPWYPAARLIRADHKLEAGQTQWLELATRCATDLTQWAGA